MFTWLHRLLNARAITRVAAELAAARERLSKVEANYRAEPQGRPYLVDVILEEQRREDGLYEELTYLRAKQGELEGGRTHP